MTDAKTGSAPAASPKDMTPTERFKAGLEDVVAGDSSICLVDGKQGRLLYRGYNILDLAEHASFAEVAHLLWYGKLPNQKEYDEFTKLFRGSIELPDQTRAILRLFPKTASPMEVLRTAVSSLGHFDPESGAEGQEANLRKAIRLTARMVSIITAHEHIRKGKDPIKPQPGKSVAWNFLYTLFGKPPSELHEKVLDVALILHADHELNASTFAGRVTAATLSDIYSSVTSAIGTLKGPLHGGANEKVMKMLLEIDSVDRAEAWLKEKLEKKVKVPGFGHRVYRTEDPRATVLREHSRAMAEHTGNKKWFEISQAVERIMLDFATKKGKPIYPNVDFYSASTYYAMGIPTELFTPIFALSRAVGWTSHILEQWSNNRLIRPRANYTGKTDLKYVPIADRP